MNSKPVTPPSQPARHAKPGLQAATIPTAFLTVGIVMVVFFITALMNKPGDSDLTQAWHALVAFGMIAALVALTVWGEEAYLVADVGKPWVYKRPAPEQPSDQDA